MIWVVVVYILGTHIVSREVPIQWTSVDACEEFAKNSPSIDSKKYFGLCEKRTAQQ